MPAIDISRYGKKKEAKGDKASMGSNIVALLNRDISFGSKELPDKKKEALYLELSSLLQAGIHLKGALDLVASDMEKEKDRELFLRIQQNVVGGAPFSEALKQTGRFSMYEVFSLQIGEEAGKLNEVLTDLAKFFGNKIKQRRKIVSALTYPAVVLSTSLGAVFFMLKFVVPMFGDVFKRFGGQLPWITEQIIRISQALQDSFFVMVIGCLILVAAWFAVRKTERYRAIVSRLLLKIPVAGNIIQKVYLARFCNSMRLLVSAQLPLLRAISLSRQMVGYYLIESTLLAVEQDILAGQSLHQSMERFGIYPKKMIQLIKVGEETNQMDYFFARIAEQYIEEVEYRTTTLSGLLEPLIIIFLGLVVGIILIAMYLPMFQLSNTMQ